MASFQDFNFSMFRGDTEVFEGAVTVAGVVVDITGCSLKFTAKRTLQDTDATAVFQCSTLEGSIVITNGPAGEYSITVESIKTQPLIAPTVCLCDVQLVDTFGNVSTMATGKLVISLDITRTDT